MAFAVLSWRTELSSTDHYVTSDLEKEKSVPLREREREREREEPSRMPVTCHIVDCLLPSVVLLNFNINSVKKKVLLSES